MWVERLRPGRRSPSIAGQVPALAGMRRKEFACWKGQCLNAFVRKSRLSVFGADAWHGIHGRLRIEFVVISRSNRRNVLWIAALFVAIPGCRALFTESDMQAQIEQEAYSVRATEVEYPNVDITVEDASGADRAPLMVTDFLDGSQIGVQQVRLEEVIRMGLQSSRIARRLGGVILRSPASTQTAQDPAIQEANPRTGIESVLSAYDATLTSSLVAEKNDRALNNFFTSGGTNILDQDLSVLQTQISKRAMTGTELTVRNNTDYDANNAGANQLPSAWNTDVEAEVRHPLLQGSGVEYNRLAGPSEIPGVANGVLIARVNTDLSLADFELGIRDFVSDIENAYWDLYYAYRNLDSKLSARDAALKTWRRVRSLKNRRGGEAVRLAQAREQYFRLQEEVQNTLSGRLLEGTRTNNGSSGGTFRATAGVQVAERRLRFLIGMPINDGRLLRPADHPIAQKLDIDWDAAVAHALSTRVELRRQRWLIKRREMELAASRNFLMPRFDAIGRYRWRGFGKDLMRQGRSNPGQFGNAVDNLMDGSFQEWQLGFELTFPFGYRHAHAAVHHAELQLARERTILDEQERAVVLDLSSARADVDRAHAVMRTSFARFEAASLQSELMQQAFEKDQAPLNLVLDAQRRRAEAESHYYRLLVEYALAVKNFHFEKGSLLNFNRIQLAESAWPEQAYGEVASRLLAARGLFGHSILSADGEPTVQTVPQDGYGVGLPTEPSWPEPMSHFDRLPWETIPAGSVTPELATQPVRNPRGASPAFWPLGGHTAFDRPVSAETAMPAAETHPPRSGHFGHSQVR